MRKRLVISLVFILAAGCVEKRLTINSQPQGALVYLNGQEVGRTPMTRDFQMYGNYDLILRKEGFTTLKTNANVRAPFWQWIPLDLFTALLPLRLQDHQNFAYAMEAVPPPSTQALLQQAQEMRQELERQK